MNKLLIGKPGLPRKQLSILYMAQAVCLQLADINRLVVLVAVAAAYVIEKGRSCCLY